MKADVFIKYKIVFGIMNKRNSSEMEVFFPFQKKEPHHNSQLIYLQIHMYFMPLYGYIFQEIEFSAYDEMWIHPLAYVRMYPHSCRKQLLFSLTNTVDASTVSCIGQAE